MNRLLVMPFNQRIVRYDWHVALILLAVCALSVVILFWPSAKSISHIWLNSQTYAHGMIIVPLALFLAWTRRRELMLLDPRPSAWGLAWLAVAGLAWMLARSVDVELVQHFALIAMLPGLVITLLGLRIARELVFPLAYLFFAVPFGDFIVPVLQEYTAGFSVLMLKLSGLSVYKEGYYISIPAGDFVVAKVCSGVRYLIASIALGLIYAYLSYRSVWRRLALVSLAIILPILANGIRAYSIIMIAHLTDMKYAVGVDHLIYGWVFFGFVMLLLFWLGSLWREKSSVTPSTGIQPTSPSQVKLFSISAIIVVMGMVLSLPRVGESWIQQQAREVAVEQPPVLPAVVNGWSGPEAVTGTWRPSYFDADTELAGVYQTSRDAVELHLFQYLNRGQGSEIVSWRNKIYDGDVWRRSTGSNQQISLGSGDQLPIRETVLRGPGDVHRLVWHWYQLGEHATIVGVEIKILEALAVLTGDGRGAFLVAVSTVNDESLEQSRQRLARFVRELPMPLGYVSDE